MDNQIDLTDLLHQMHDWGFTYFPIIPNTKDPACRGSWKKPENHMSPVEVIARIDRGSNYGINLPEGVFVIDFDSDEVYRCSIEKAPVIAESLTFKTPKGYHVLFTGQDLPQGASHTLLGVGTDLRIGGKGYIVGPGSTRDGKRYEYMSGDEILDAPESLCALLQKPASQPTSELFPGGQAPPGSATGNTRPLTIQERGQAARKHWKALEGAQEGERNDTIARAACGLGSLYADAEQDKRDEVFARLIDHAERLGDADPAEIKQNRTTAENQWLKGAESPATRPNNSESENTYRMVFAKFDSHEFERALDNLNISLRSHEGRDQFEFFIHDDGSWEIPKAYRFKTNEWFVADDKTAETMMFFINYYFGKQKGDNVFGVSITKDKFWQWVAGIASRNPVNPFRDWIDECQIDPNLEGLTLDNWMNPWLKDRGSPLNQWVQRAIMVAIVQNVYGDPQPCRVIPVLRGEKGIGKTTLVSNLLPDLFRYHFGQFHVTRTAEMVGSLIGKYLCELGELDGLSPSKATVFKAFVGNLDNTVRRPYGRHFVDYRNLTLVIGTSNPDRNIPNDDAVRDRLVVVDLAKGPDPKLKLPDILPHIYALAREAYEDGERVDTVPEEHQYEQLEASAESVIVNDVFDVKLRLIDWRQIAEWFTIYDILLAAGLISRKNMYIPNGAQKAVKDLLVEYGVGITRKEMKKKGPSKIWHYQESNRIKEIRDEQIKQSGAMPPMYGHKARKLSNDISVL